ncbi:MAG: hypothetical protein ACTSQA_02480, partial [Candidatus Heimdallarchaeaceae archaeon]
FGPITKAGAIKFQEKYADDVLAYWGLTSGTGYVGQTTRDKLNSLLETAGEEPADDDDDDGEVPAGDGLTIAFADDNPGATTIVADDTSAQGAQSMIPFLKVKLTNGDSSEVKVTQISFKRSGISADADISQSYLYEGDTLLAEYSAYSNSILTFSNSAGLVTIPAGESKIVTLKADLADGTGSGKTMRFSIDSASDVVSDASAVEGSFGLVGSYMSTASTADLGQLTVANVTDPSTAVDPQEGFDVFNFSLVGSDQKVEVRKLKFTNIGSTAYNDLANFKLYDGATQVGDVIANMETDKTVTFDLSDDPIVIDKGITKTMYLKADIVGGTNRTFQFSFQNMTDITVYDTQYGVFIKPNGADSWTVIEASAASSINTGAMTLSRASDTPAGNVALGATNVTIAKFDLKATGEDAKITAMTVRVYGTDISTDDLYQGKVYFDGSQKGTTDTVLASNATDVSTTENIFTFGNTFVVPADGETHSLEIKADIKEGDGTVHGGNEEFTVKIHSVTATGKTSLAAVDPGTATGYELGIRTGTLTTAKSQAVSNWTAANPTGVPGVTDTLVGSFVVSAGSSEGADITSIVMQHSTTTPILQNLKLYNGTKETGTQIGATRATVAVDTNYTFYPSPNISLAQSSDFVLNVYADIKTGFSAGANGFVQLGIVSGTGKVTNTSVNSSGTVDGQTIWLLAAGDLTAAAASDQPKAAQVMMSDTDVVFNKIKLTATAGETIQVTEVVVTSTMTGLAPVSSVQNISLWDGATQIGSTKSGLVAAGTATFDLSSSPWEIPASTDKTLTIKADVNNYAYASSGASIALGVKTTGITAKGSVSGTDCDDTGAVLGTAMYTYKTKVTVAVNSGTPSGASYAGTGRHVLYFDVTNDGAFDAELNAVTFGIDFVTGTGSATATGDVLFKIYDSIDTATALGTGTIADGQDISTTTLAIDLSPDYAIPAGATKTFYIIGDTTDCGATSGSSAGSQLRFYINAGTDFNWDDKVSTAVETARTKTFPVYGETLTY